MNQQYQFPQFWNEKLSTLDTIFTIIVHLLDLMDSIVKGTLLVVHAVSVDADCDESHSLLSALERKWDVNYRINGLYSYQKGTKALAHNFGLEICVCVNIEA